MTATAQCPAGKVVIGGSGQISDSGASDRYEKMHFAAGIPINPAAPGVPVTDGSATAWEVLGTSGSDGIDYQFRAIAICSAAN